MADLRAVRRGNGRFCSSICANSSRTGRKKKSLKDRFLDGTRFVVDKKTQCFVWSGKKSFHGYGKIKNDLGKEVLAHRVSFEIHTGLSAEGMCVLHKCDNPPCVNPDHLFIGTQQDNLIDMHKKGRARGNTKPRKQNA